MIQPPLKKYYEVMTRDVFFCQWSVCVTQLLTFTLHYLPYLKCMLALALYVVNQAQLNVWSPQTKR